ncbi:MAG: serine protease [bacterium]
MIASKFQGTGFAILCAVLMSCTVTLSDPASDSVLPYVVKIRSSLDVQSERTLLTQVRDSGVQWSWPFYWTNTRTVKHSEVKPLSLSAIGSAWLIDAKCGDLVVVTAAHVIFDGIQHPDFNSNSDKLLGRKVRCLIGITDVEPSKIAVPVSRSGLGESKRTDVALMKVSSSSLLKIAQPLPLADRLPHQMETVKVISFQDNTAYQQIDTAIVAAVVPEKGIFVLNKEIPAGGSGGAVVDVSNNCFGVVSNTDKGQTIVYSVTSEMIKHAQWMPMVTNNIQ